MWCKFFFYLSGTNYNIFFEKIKSIKEDYTIITNSFSIQNFLKDKQFKVLLIEEIIPDQGKIAEEVYRDGKKIFEKYRKIFKSIQYDDLELFGGFDYQFLRQIVFQMKIKKIFENKQNYVFIFEGYNSSYLLIYKIANELKFNTESEITTIKNNKIRYFKKTQFENLSTAISQTSFQKLIRSFNNKNENTKLNNFHVGIKIIKRLSSVILESIIYKINSLGNTDPINIINERIMEKIKNSSSEILFVLTTTRIDLYLKQWYSVFKKLEENNIKFRIVTGDFVTSSILSEEEISFLDFFKEANILAKELKNFKIGKNILRKFEEVSQNYSNLSELSFYEEDLKKKILRTISNIVICNKIIKTLNVKVVVNCADGEMFENAMTLVCRKENIPTFSIVPAILSNLPIFSDWFHSDKIFCYGKNDYDLFLKLGYGKNRLIMTGNPKYDNFISFNQNETKNILLKKYELPLDKKIILLAMSEWHSDDDIWMSKLIEFSNRNNFFIIIKIHPKYKITSKVLSKKKIDDIKKKCRNYHFIITEKIEMAYLIGISDLVISDYSTSLMEAILLEKPVININLDFKERDRDLIELPLVDENISFFVDKYNNLEKLILEILENKVDLITLRKKMKGVIEKYNFPNDGQATKRITKLILQNLKTDKNN